MFNGVGIIPLLKEGGWYIFSGFTTFETCIFIGIFDSVQLT
jgi:hypothetical protein